VIGDGDRGSATVWLLAVVMLVWLVAGAVLADGNAVAARHHAATAADLAALAGAAVASGAQWTNALPTGALPNGALPTGHTEPPAACSAARSVAAANGARLLDCHVDGVTVAVVAATPLGRLAQLLRLGSAAAARATAKAGPA
jgi:hypothetical protein